MIYDTSRSGAASGAGNSAPSKLSSSIRAGATTTAAAATSDTHPFTYARSVAQSQQLHHSVAGASAASGGSRSYEDILPDPFQYQSSDNVQPSIEYFVLKTKLKKQMRTAATRWGVHFDTYVQKQARNQMTDFADQHRRVEERLEQRRQELERQEELKREMGVAALCTSPEAAQEESLHKKQQELDERMQRLEGRLPKATTSSVATSDSSAIRKKSSLRFQGAPSDPDTTDAMETTQNLPETSVDALAEEESAEGLRVELHAFAALYTQLLARAQHVEAHMRHLSDALDRKRAAEAEARVSGEGDPV